MYDSYSLIPISPDMPAGTDFCLVLDSREMEPLIKKGERIYVSRRESPGDMEAGIFLYGGKILCRQICEDYAGRLHLLCANPQCESENLCLDKEEKQRCRCLGKVLLKAKPPRPLYY